MNNFDPKTLEQYLAQKYNTPLPTPVKPEVDTMSPAILQGAGQIVEGLTGVQGDLGASVYEDQSKREVAEYLAAKNDHKSQADDAEKAHRWGMTHDLQKKRVDLEGARLREARTTKRDDKRDIDIRERTVPGVGVAMTKGDAKLLKSATEMKAKFDSQLDEMLALRKTHSGGAIFAREDIARGKQLSKDLLLTYKNLAKLGVLSKSDEDIINAIIPKDPLEYQVAGLMGEDPISHKLTKFKSDSDNQYRKSLETRLETNTTKSTTNDKFDWE